MRRREFCGCRDRPGCDRTAVRVRRSSREDGCVAVEHGRWRARVRIVLHRLATARSVIHRFRHGRSIRLRVRRLIACPRCFDRSGRSSSCSPWSRSGPWPLRPRPLRSCRPRPVGRSRVRRGWSAASTRRRCGGEPAIAASIWPRAAATRCWRPRRGRSHFAGRVGGKPVVSIDHGGVRTTYEPVQAMVLAGQRVAMGQLIGRVSSGGHCGQRCLHWGLRDGLIYLNPLLLIRAGDARLRLVAEARRGVVIREARARAEAAAAAAAGRDLRRPGRAGGQSRLHPSGLRRRHLPVRDAVPSDPQALEVA